MDQQMLKEAAADLLEILWRGIAGDYKSRYRRTIWEQFENQVRASAYTSNLGRFVNSACLKLGVTIPGEFTARAEEILNSGRDKSLLKLYRDETTLIVLMVRLRNQERREAWEEKQAEKTLFDMTAEEIFGNSDKETEE